MIKKSLIMFSVFTLIGLSVPAEEKADSHGSASAAEGAKADGNAEKKEGQEKSAGPAAGPSQQQQYMELVAKLSAAKSKINSKQEAIKKLIEEKESVKSNAKASEIVTQLITEHKELTTIIKEYEENRNILKFRFPEKGTNEIRKYERIESKSLEEMQTQFSLEGRISKTLKKAKKQYKVEEKTDDNQNKPENILGDNTDKGSGKNLDKKNRPAFNEPIIIKK